MVFVLLSHSKTAKITYVYQSFGWWMKEWLVPLLPGSLADLLNRNSWSFCFTSVLATAPVRPTGRNKGIGVTLGLWHVTYYCTDNTVKSNFMPLITCCFPHLFSYITINMLLEFKTVLKLWKLFLSSPLSSQLIRFALASRAPTTCVGRSPPSGQKAPHKLQAAKVILPRDVLSHWRGYGCRAQFQITWPDKVINPFYY